MGAQPRLVHQLRPGEGSRVASRLRQVPPSGPAPHGPGTRAARLSRRLERQRSTRLQLAPEEGDVAAPTESPARRPVRALLWYGALTIQGVQFARLARVSKL